MCDFCEGKENLTTAYVDVDMQRNVPFYGNALRVFNIRKGCPKFSNCCDRDMQPQVVFEIKYCPMCGEKLS